MTLILPSEGEGNWDDSLNAVLRALDRRTDRIFTPWQYGAVGDGETDDTDAINEAVEDAQDNDGLLFINGRFGFAAEVFFKGGVPVWASGTARFPNPGPGVEPGLVALDADAQVRWGKFSDGSGSLNDNPGPIYNLVVDGAGIGGASGGLFRAEAVQVSAYDLQVMNSAGDGLHLASSQNVNFYNFQSHGHAVGAGVMIKARVAGAQPPGHCIFVGGHIGDCYVPIFATSHDDSFFVGPHDNVFYAPIIETGRTDGLGILAAVVLEDGNLAMVNPTITIGAEVTEIEENASIVVRNTIRPSQSTILTIHEPYGIGGGAGAVKADDLIRIEQAGGAFNEVRITGVPSFANANEAAVCFDGGAALYSCDGRPRFITAGFDHMRAINGGDLSGVYQRTNTPRRIEVPADSSVSALGIREDGKAANAVQVSKGGEVRFLDPDTGATRAVVSPLSGGGLLINGSASGVGNLLEVLAVTTASRPSAGGFPHRVIIDTDLNQVMYSDGTNWLPADKWSQINSNRVTGGSQETYPREFGITTGAQTSGLLRLTYFTAYQSMTVASLRSATGAVAAAATPTTCKMGLYSVAANGDLTRIGITANDTSLWSVANTVSTKALTSSVAVTAGSRYALATLCVSGATVPNLVGRTISQVIANDNNRLGGSLSSQTDIPSSITAGSVAVNGVAIYGELVP